MATTGWKAAPRSKCKTCNEFLTGQDRNVCTPCGYRLCGLCSGGKYKFDLVTMKEAKECDVCGDSSDSDNEKAKGNLQDTVLLETSQTNVYRTSLQRRVASKNKKIVRGKNDLPSEDEQKILDIIRQAERDQAPPKPAPVRRGVAVAKPKQKRRPINEEWSETDTESERELFKKRRLSTETQYTKSPAREDRRKEREAAGVGNAAADKSKVRPCRDE